jgi:ubiquinone/menaquinone biosynthesis C-methylase UbiE
VKTKVEKFPPYYGPEWDKKINDPDDPNFWKYKVANLVFLDYVEKRRTILDIGCGTGGSSLFVAKHGKPRLLVGVDIVRSMIQVARRNAIKKGLDKKVCFIACDGRHLPFKPSCFEAIIARGDSFCFLLPIKKAVKEFKRVLSSTGIIAMEIDNRSDWKPNTVVSTGFRKTTDNKVVYQVEFFDSSRNHIATSYVLDPAGKLVREISSDREFAVKGYKKCVYPLKIIEKEATEIRRGVSTHWPTIKELRNLFKKAGYKRVKMQGDGLLMNLLLEGGESIKDAMKKQPSLFFEIERMLIPYIDPEKAPTYIFYAACS